MELRPRPAAAAAEEEERLPPERTESATQWQPVQDCRTESTNTEVQNQDNHWNQRQEQFLQVQLNSPKVCSPVGRAELSLPHWCYRYWGTLLTFGKLPKVLGGEDAGSGDGVVTDNSVVRIVRKAFEIEVSGMFLIMNFLSGLWVQYVKKNF